MAVLIECALFTQRIIEKLNKNCQDFLKSPAKKKYSNFLYNPAWYLKLCKYLKLLLNLYNEQCQLQVPKPQNRPMSTLGTIVQTKAEVKKKD